MAAVRLEVLVTETEAGSRGPLCRPRPVDAGHTHHSVAVDPASPFDCLLRDTGDGHFVGSLVAS
jgi:hypothetical protein